MALKVACSWFRQNLLLFLIVIGVAAGFIIGLTVNDAVQHSKDPSPKELTMYIAFAGEIFLRMLMMIILPLITSSIIVAVAVLDSKSTGKLGKRALIYYLSTTLLAVVVGIILVSSIKPGEKASTRKPKEQAHAEAVHSILDLVRYNMKILPNSFY